MLRDEFDDAILTSYTLCSLCISVDVLFCERHESRGGLLVVSDLCSEALGYFRCCEERRTRLGVALAFVDVEVRGGIRRRMEHAPMLAEICA